MAFVKKQWIIIFSFFLCTYGAAYVPLLNNRETVNFNQNWKFIKSNPTGAQNPSFNDESWDNIGLPHTYNEFDIFDQWSDEEWGDGGWNGKTWYRKTFTIDPKYRDRMIYLEIVAARTVADVWINGRKAGDTYYSGFSSFAVDLTPYLNFGSSQTNVLAIRVDDTEGEDIVPGNISHWHPAYGGLYSNVRLHIMDKLHVTLPFYSFLKTEGTYIGCTQVSSSSAQFRMTTQVKNNYAAMQSCQLTTEIIDASGTIVSILTATQAIDAGTVHTFDQSGTIANPHRWSPADPYLYTAYSTLKISGIAVDVYKTMFGVRTIRWDLTTKMFTINDVPLLLKGWGQKPTNEYASLGPAVPDWLHAQDIKLMKEAGGNIVRWGHCAGLPAALDAGDRLGVMQWQPNISCESDYSGTPYDRKLIVERDILIRDRNHPSLVLWEGNNDISSRAHSQEWRNLVHQWDWISPRPYGERRPQNCDLMDVSIETNNKDEYCPDLPNVESEFYRPEPPRRYWDEESPLGPHPCSLWGRTQRQAMREIISDWESISARGGGVKWHFSDACTHGRIPTEVCRCSGVLDGVHIPKDIYYAFKAIWREDPQVHIMGHWNYTTPHNVDVYTNCEEVELFVNNVSKGCKSPSQGRCSWFAVSFQPGSLRAVGRINGIEVCSDERNTAGEPHYIALSVITDPEGMKADGSDVALVDAVVVDSLGIWCPTADNQITFRVSGPGTYRGGYNSYIQNTPGKTMLHAEAGRIRVGIRSTEIPGVITVGATAEGLQPATISFTSIRNDVVGIQRIDVLKQNTIHSINGIRKVCQKGNQRFLHISYYLDQPSPVIVSILLLNGKMIQSYVIENSTTGMNVYKIPLLGNRTVFAQGCYILQLSMLYGGDSFSRFILIN